MLSERPCTFFFFFFFDLRLKINKSKVILWVLLFYFLSKGEIRNIYLKPLLPVINFENTLKKERNIAVNKKYCNYFLLSAKSEATLKGSYLTLAL